MRFDNDGYVTVAASAEASGQTAVGGASVAGIGQSVSGTVGEVELTTNLIIAASESDEHLSKGQIDEILGVDDQKLQAG